VYPLVLTSYKKDLRMHEQNTHIDSGDVLTFRVCTCLFI